MVSNFSKSSHAWKDRLKHWAYTCTFVASQCYYTIQYYILLSSWYFYNSIFLFPCCAISHDTAQVLLYEPWGYILLLFAGKWSSSPTTGPRPPPCYFFSFTAINDHQAVLFGGKQPQRRRVNDCFLMDFESMVCPERCCNNSVIMHHTTMNEWIIWGMISRELILTDDTKYLWVFNFQPFAKIFVDMGHTVFMLWLQEHRWTTPGTKLPHPQGTLSKEMLSM